ncbi:SID1 transmembrane family member 1-like [Prorops nasuta]|uniref:SID1 transmembrane family member 1-like n=1 Tax=Prorops nasuta TaxID=863751 RepID=UPI0034CFE6B3
MQIMGNLSFMLLFYCFIRVGISSSVSLYPNVINANYSQTYNHNVNSSLEYVFIYHNDTDIETARICVESNATHNSPLIVVARQRQGTLSWQLPFIIENKNFTSSYNRTSRLLCSTKYYHSSIGEQKEFVFISISTASDIYVNFQLTVVKEAHFYMKSGEERSAVISPADPTYFGYNFANDTRSSSVVIEVSSDNDTCMTVSIQEASCPVFDLERNVQFVGYWETVSKLGGITVAREAFSSGFFIVLVVKGDDTDCVGYSSMKANRFKNVRVTVSSNIARKDYIIACSIALTIVMGFCISYMISAIVAKVKKSRETVANEILNNEIRYTEDALPGPATVKGGAVDDSSLDEDDVDIMNDVTSDKHVRRMKLVLSVSDLAHKEPKILRHKSRLYLYYLITVAIFYTLPAVQLVWTNQRVLHVTGNQDLCYYNFLCSHPITISKYYFSDFNHIFSNFGYVLLGLLFIFLTYMRETNVEEMERNKCYGVPQHYGLFYAMGFALMMEGLLSATYHVCPNQNNFQFDTSFMYIISVLCMVKIYQTRHPDINARAPVTFGVLAVIILLSLIGVFQDSKNYRIVFAVIYLLVCLLLIVKIYYMGQIKFNRRLILTITTTLRYDRSAGIANLLRPIYCSRFVLLVIVYLSNFGLAIFGCIDYKQSFPQYLLGILIGNLILYTFFYIMMKIICDERILLTPLIYILISFVLWGFALHFFINNSVSWNVTPALSRLKNKPCQHLLMNFFDNHDVWHFLSAFAMFFSFMVLLTLDDDLMDTHRSQISVF